MTGPGQAAVPAPVPLRRLREGSRPRRTMRGLLMDIVPWAVPAAVGVALAIGAVRLLGRLLTETGRAVPGAPGHLFAVAAALLLLGVLAQLLRSAGPVMASSAFWFWLLSAPVRRRDLLRRRYLALLAVTAVLAAAALGAGTVCGQAWELVLHGPALAAAAVVTGYCLVLPVAGTLRQLAANPGLRAQFAPHDRWLSLASLATCLLASATWTAIVTPGLGGGIALAALITAGLTAAAYRTVTRPPLDYSGPLLRGTSRQPRRRLHDTVAPAVPPVPPRKNEPSSSPARRNCSPRPATPRQSPRQPR